MKKKKAVPFGTTLSIFPKDLSRFRELKALYSARIKLQISDRVFFGLLLDSVKSVGGVKYEN